MNLAIQQDGGEWMPQGEVFYIENILVSFGCGCNFCRCHRRKHSTCQCDIHKVDFRIVYDDDVYGARIIAEGPSAEGDDEYNVVCNHLIGDIQLLITWYNSQIFSLFHKYSRM